MLHIEFEELSDDLFGEEDYPICLKLDQRGCLRLEAGQYGYDGLLEANLAVLAWELPPGLTARAFLELLAKAWPQLEKVHRNHQVTGTGIAAKGSLNLIGQWALDVITVLIVECDTRTPASTQVSQFPWLQPRVQ